MAESRAARVFLYDARMVLALANHARYLTLNRVFGVSRDQANLLTGVFALGAAEATYATARKALHAPGLSADGASIGALALREAALAVGGPGSRRVPGFGALVALALAGGVALPSLRRGAHSVRMAEQHLRERRMRMFDAMRLS
jgi:hypothetical protein